MAAQATRMQRSRWLSFVCCMGWVSFLLLSPSFADEFPVSSFFIPKFDHGTDSLGNHVSTEIEFINLSIDTSEVEVMTYGNDGSPMALLEQGASAEPVSSLIVSISGTGTARVRSRNADPNSTLTSGWVDVATRHAVGVQVTYRIVQPDGAIVTATRLRLGPLVTAVSFMARVSNESETTIALLNPPGNVPASVSIEAIGSQGDSLTMAFVELQPGEKMAISLSQYLPDLSDLPDLGDFDGSIEIRSRNLDDPESSTRPPLSILPLIDEDGLLIAQGLFPPRQRP